MLYIRMLLTIAVSLYTSRIVLSTLGETDYGIYNVVGGVVSFFAFLNTCMSGATSRFLTVEMKQGNHKRLHETFCTALMIHVTIAIIVFIFAESIGLWFLNNKLNIPDDRMFAANIVYQCSVLSMMVTITQVPYNATIISHEKMDIYAYIELLNVFLKLGIVYLLLIGDFDKLILYSVLILIVNIFIASTYRIYCIKNYLETHFKFILIPQILRPMLTFSVWDLYGNMSVSARQQGLSVIINIFFGTVLNAACGIASMVQGVISHFSANILLAFRPQIIKKYAASDYMNMQKMMENAIKLSTLMLLCITMPLISEINYVMNLWLETPPIYATSFCKILLIMNIIGILNSSCTTAIHATGNIKLLSFSAGTVAIMNLPIIYIAFKYFTNEPQYAYYILLFSAIIMITISLIILKRNIPQLSVISIIKTFIFTIFAGIITYIPLIILKQYMPEGFTRLTMTILIYITLLLTYSYYLLLTSDNRKYIKDFIYKKFNLRIK